MMKKQNRDLTTLYRTPFHAGYWRMAVSECKNLRMLIVAAMIVALRITVKLFTIPVGENLHISLDFLVNSVGSMVYGPVLGLLVGAVSDTLGCLLVPSGDYFFPFIFVEMASSFLFGLFLYRAKMSHLRTILSRFGVVVFCNYLLNPYIMEWYYRLILGKEYTFFKMARVYKSAALFPLESLILIFWIEAISRVTHQLKLTPAPQEKKRITWGDGIFIAFLTLVSVAAILWYTLVYLKK